MTVTTITLILLAALTVPLVVFVTIKLGTMAFFYGRAKARERIREEKEAKNHHERNGYKHRKESE